MLLPAPHKGVVVVPNQTCVNGLQVIVAVPATAPVNVTVRTNGTMKLPQHTVKTPVLVVTMQKVIWALQLRGGQHLQLQLHQPPVPLAYGELQAIYSIYGMVCICSCTTTVNLIAQGGAGCGTEYTNGILYSIGSQYFSLTYIDTCSTVSFITINNNVISVAHGGIIGNLPFISDGQPITISLNLPGTMSVCSTTTYCLSSGNSIPAGIITPCCPNNAVSPTLYATFTTTSAGCTCLDGVIFTLNYDSSSGAWEDTYTGTCSQTAGLALVCTNNTWALQGIGCLAGLAGGTPTAVTCSPFSLTFNGSIGAGNPCCNGTFTVSVSDQPPMGFAYITPRRTIAINKQALINRILRAGRKR